MSFTDVLGSSDAMPDARVDRTFEMNYRVQVELDFPSGIGDGRMVYFPDKTTVGGKDGIVIRLASWQENHEQERYGMFPFGMRGGKYEHGIFSCPNKDMVLVVSAGQGYYTAADFSDSTLVLPLFPLVGVAAAKEAGLLFFHDFSRVGALSAAGIAWVSNRIFTDGLKIIGSGRDSLVVEGWDAKFRKTSEVEIAFGDGSIRGAK